MKFFLDSAKLDEIDYAYRFLGIDGVTTNPRHIMLSGKSFDQVIEELARWVKANNIEGREVFPISIEINPHIENWEEMYAEGKAYSQISSNFVVKIPCTEQGLIAARKLELEGIRTNVTLVFSASQAIWPGKFNAMFVSPFVGWKENHGDDCEQYIRQIVEVYRIHKFNTKIIVAALRNAKQIKDAAAAGADIVTCGLQVYKESIEHPFTTYGLSVFRDSWDKTTKEQLR
jgi:transaldolase